MNFTGSKIHHATSPAPELSVSNFRFNTTLLGHATKKKPDDLICGEFDLEKDGLGRLEY